MAASDKRLDEGLAGLQIERSRRRGEPVRWTKWWILIGVVLFLSLGAWRYGFGTAEAFEVETVRVVPETSGGSDRLVVLNAAGYIVPHHKIEVASKVVGRVAWIGVEKGDKVRQGQIIVRLEDDEFQARVRQSEGNLEALRARLNEAQAGSRPEEIELAKANLEEARADLENARINIERVRKLTEEGVFAQQQLDDAQARYEAQQARAQSLERAYELVRIGPRQEQIDALRGQVRQAEGELDFARTMLDGTVIRAPVDGTILERNVETGEFVTTSFVGERGAKGYVASLADLNDLQVELDISQDDFARLRDQQKATVVTDAFPDREYEGYIAEISPEADRQKATVQVKVQIVKPDDYLRPEMNANVAFLADREESHGERREAVITIPTTALRDGNSVFVVVDGKAMRRSVAARRGAADRVEISEGLVGGEDVIVNPPAELQDGDAVKPRPT